MNNRDCNFSKQDIKIVKLAIDGLERELLNDLSEAEKNSCRRITMSQFINEFIETQRKVNSMYNMIELDEIARDSKGSNIRELFYDIKFGSGVNVACKGYGEDDAKRRMAEEQGYREEAIEKMEVVRVYKYWRFDNQNVYGGGIDKGSLVKINSDGWMIGYDGMLGTVKSINDNYDCHVELSDKELVWCHVDDLIKIK